MQCFCRDVPSQERENIVFNTDRLQAKLNYRVSHRFLKPNSGLGKMLAWNQKLCRIGSILWCTCRNDWRSPCWPVAERFEGSLQL